MYSLEVIDLLRGQPNTSSGSGIDGRILAVTTDDQHVRDLVVKAEGVATWEASRGPDSRWLIYLAPAHGMTVLTLRDRVTQLLSEGAGHPD